MAGRWYSHCVTRTRQGGKGIYYSFLKFGGQRRLVIAPLSGKKKASEEKRRSDILNLHVRHALSRYTT